MTQVDILKNARDPRSSGYKVDVNRGERIGRVSSEWCSRPRTNGIYHCQNSSPRYVAAPTEAGPEPRRARQYGSK